MSDNGKGDRNRIGDKDRFDRNFDNIKDFGQKAFSPKEPFKTDIKKYESKFRGKEMSK